MQVRLTAAERIRLLMTADSVGGVWTYALDLAGGLAGLGVETTLAVLGPPPMPHQRDAAVRVPGLLLLPLDLPLDWTAASSTELRRAGTALAAIATELAPDIIHLNNPALGAEARFPAPVVAMCHSCVASWWRAVRTGPLPPELAWRAELLAKAYGTADALVAPSHSFAQVTKDLYDLHEAPAVVRNGRQVPAPTPADEPPDPAGSRVVFTAGRLWDEGKNLLTLDRAASRIRLPVLAAGPLEGPNGARTAPRHVVPLGSLPEEGIRQQLLGKPIFVSVARYEPFGLAALEAAQAGCALVLSDIPTFRELWDGAAEFVAPDDDAGLATVLEGVAKDPARRARLGQSARLRAQRYTVEAMAGGMHALYRRLAPHPAAREVAA